MKTMWKAIILAGVVWSMPGFDTFAQPAGGEPNRRGGQERRGDRDAPRPPEDFRRIVLERFDKNGDGELDESEREKAREEMRRNGPPGNGPGGSSRGRSRRPGRETIKLVEKFDKDEDGVLNKAERTEARKHVKEVRRRGGGEGRRGFGPGGPGGPPDRGRRDRGDRPPDERQGQRPDNARDRRGPDGSPPGRNRGGRGRRGGERERTPRDFSKAEKLSPGKEPDPKTALYDEGTLRTLFINFKDDEWKEEMQDFYRTDVAVPADLTVSGKLYNDVGLRFRGNSSFFGVSPDLKRSMNLYVDHKLKDQRLHGYRTLNLLNANSDPTFMREVLYSRIARDYIPAFKGNFLKVVINGESWGVYANIQQYNKDFLDDNFGSRDGVRWKIAAGRGGGSLTYDGDDKENYSRYELKTDGADDAWKDLAKFTKILNTTPPDELVDALGPLFDIDGALWSLALENVFIDEGYLARGSDYNLYLNPQGRFHLLQHDGNEVFNIPHGPGMPPGLDGPILDPFYNAENEERPIMYRLFQVPHLRARYVAHMRTIVEEWLDWKRIGPIVEGYHDLLDAEIKKDVRKLYDYVSFSKGHLETVGEGRRKTLGIRNFVEERHEFLQNHPEISRPVPEVMSVSRETTGNNSGGKPVPAESIRVIASTGGKTRTDAMVLYHSPGKHSPFQHVTMLDDGRHGDGEAADGVFAAEIPPHPAGTKVRYYVEARHGGEVMTVAFHPSKAEAGPLTYRVRTTKADGTSVVINEVMAQNESTLKDPQGEFDDWIELLNISESKVDMSGKYLSDNKKNPRKWRFPDGTIIDSGGYLLVWADEDGKADDGLHANFKLSRGGETLLLVDTDEAGNGILDEVQFANQQKDTPSRRLPDGKGSFAKGRATPGARNTD